MRDEGVHAYIAKAAASESARAAAELGAAFRSPSELLASGQCFDVTGVGSAFTTFVLITRAVATSVTAVDDDGAALRDILAVAAAAANLDGWTGGRPRGNARTGRPHPFTCRGIKLALSGSCTPRGEPFMLIHLEDESCPAKLPQSVAEIQYLGDNT